VGRFNLDISPDSGGFWVSELTVKLSSNILLEIWRQSGILYLCVLAVREEGS
jgi:hypothetical protein